MTDYLETWSVRAANFQCLLRVVLAMQSAFVALLSCVVSLWGFLHSYLAYLGVSRLLVVHELVIFEYFACVCYYVFDALFGWLLAPKMRFSCLMWVH